MASPLFGFPHSFREEGGMLSSAWGWLPERRDKGLMNQFSKLSYAWRGRGHRVLDFGFWTALDLHSDTNSHLFSQGLWARTPASLSLLSCEMEVKVSIS